MTGNDDASWGELEERRPDRELDATSILRRLVDGGIDFVVVGGLAVAAHGFVRATKDVDVVPNPDPGNLATLEDALFAIHARPVEQADLRPEEMPVAWEPGALGYGGNWALDTDHGRIDILQYVDRVEVVETYVELRGDALVTDVPDVGAVRFASLEHLELMKRVAARPQDLRDLEELRRLRGA